MKKKLPWLKYDMKKAEYVETKEQENDAKKKLDEAAKILNDLREPIEYGYFSTRISYYRKFYDQIQCILGAIIMCLLLFTCSKKVKHYKV